MTAYLVTHYCHGTFKVLGIFRSQIAAEAKAMEIPEYAWITPYNLETGEPV